MKQQWEKRKKKANNEGNKEAWEGRRKGRK